jgi:LPXTG-site transpeptidase (sortase) family protein
MSKLRKTFSIVIISSFVLAFLPTPAVQAAQAALASETVDFRPLLAPVAGVTIDAPANPFIGDALTLTITFDNTDPTDTGYGPYIDLFLPLSGADGQNPPSQDDGITFTSADYLGGSVTTQTLDCPAGGTVTHPLTGQIINCPAQPPGLYSPFVWQMVVITLPFGSFVADQPPAPITINTQLSNYADAGVDLPIHARGGFMFGADPLDNPSTDPPIQGDMTSANVTPSLFTLEKTYNDPEDETATGPDFPRRYTVTAEIAPGQTMSPFTLSDILPANMQFVSLVSTNPGGATCTLPSTTTPGGTLSCDFASASGTVTMTFEYYIPLRDSGGASVIDPVTGNDVTSCNNASGGGTWTPLDPRDTYGTFTQDPAGCEHVLTDKSIAIQKSSDVGEGGLVAPDQVVTYYHDFQISDFFAFNGVVVTDTISDGQHFYSSFTPTLQINGNTYALSALGMDAANYDVTCNYTGGPGAECDGDNLAANDGTTTLTFRISDEIITRGRDGKLIGGCVPPTGTGGDPDCGAYNDGPTTGRIVYRTVIQDQFTDTYPSGDPSVDQGDRLDNNVTVNGDLLSTSDASTPTGQSESDTSYEWVQVEVATVTKSIYAINDSTSFSTPVHVSPGDTVTFRLTYPLPTSDFEDLVLTDFLPLPVFHATEVTPVSPELFNYTICGVPAAGLTCLGPADTYHLIGPPPPLHPDVSNDSAANSVIFTYDDYDQLGATASTIDLLFTVTVSNDPFADGLYLTNQVQATEGSTNSGSTSSVAISQILLDEPAVVDPSKGAVWTNGPNGVFSPSTVGPVAFDGSAATCAGRLGGTVTSSGLAANPVDSNLSGVDAGDTVMMAIILENTGHYSAFDVQVKDSLPADMTLVPDSLCVTDGTGASFIYIDVNLVNSGLFGDGIELVDPGPTVTPPGALAPGKDSNNAVIDTGRNIAVITYLVTLDSTVQSSQVLTNTATLFNYSNTEDGANFIPDGLTDTAQVTITSPQAAKTLVGTEIVNAGNASSQAVIGELVTYQVTLTIPEGTTLNAGLVDTLDSGLAFVALDSAVLSPALSISGSTTPSVSPGGQVVTFGFGTVTNSDTNNATPETITLTYRVVVLNVISNQSGTLLNNSAQFTWGGGSASASAPEVAVIEPTINTTKSVLPTTADAGDTVAFTVTLANPAAGSTTAHDVTWSDTVPAGLIYVPSSLALGACTASTPLTLSDADAPTLTASGGLFQPGESCEITFQATVDYTATPGQVVTNTAETRWTSLPGAVSDRSPYNTDSDERTGADGLLNSGALNDYRTWGQADLIIQSTAPQKYLLATSEAHTGAVGGTERVTIGEIVRYRLVVQLPEGTSPNFQIRDYLPTGLTYLDDGTAKAAFVSNGAGITSSNYGTLPVPGITDSDCLLTGNSADGTTPAIPAACSALADNSVGSTGSTDIDDDTYNTGSDPYFKLGTLTNNDSDADAEYVIIEFNALVDNTVTGSNDAGDNRTDNFRVFINDVQNGDPSNDVTVSIAEPVLTLTKAVTTAPSDAGDPLVYTLTITNTSSGDNRATAFDLVLTDTFDAYLTGLSVSSVASTQGAVCVGNGSGTTAFTHNGGSFAGSTLTFTASCLDPGQSITVTINATVVATTPAGYTIPNTANLTYTSLPGAGTSPNLTGSTTPGASGAGDGERNGQDGVGGALNDYAAAARTPADLTPPAIDKRAPTPPSAPIGGTVTFPILVTLPEGVTQNLTVIDNLPVGLVYVSHSVVTSAASSGGLLAADYNGTLPAPTVTALGGSGDDLTLAFGDTTTAADNVTNNNAFVVFVTARVNNESGNQNSAILANYARLTYTDPESGLTTIADPTAENATVLEPELNIAKSADDTTPAYGQTLTYALAVTHLPTSTSTAYDIVVTDTIPAGLTYISGSISAPAGWTTNDAFAPTLTWSCSAPCSLPLADSANLTYQVTVNGPPAPPNPGDVLTNTASMTWTSLDGADANERTGAGGINDYADSSTQSVTLTYPDLTITKTDGQATYVPGAPVTYTIVVSNVGNGDALLSQVSDAKPSQITFWAWTCTGATGGATGCNPYGPGPLDFTNTVNLPAGSSITYTVTAQTDPAATTNLVNTATVTPPAGITDPTPGDNTDTDTDTPNPQADLSVTKDDGVTIVAPDATISYTILVNNAGPSDAVGATVSDPKPVQIDTWDWACTTSGGATCTPQSGLTGDFTDTVNIPAGSSITYTVTAHISATATSGTLTNTITVTPPSDVTDMDPTNNSDDDTDNILAEFSKSLVATNQGFTPNSSVVIGEILTYEIIFTVHAGGTMSSLTLTDVLDRGLAFLGCESIATSDPAITTTLPGGFTDACNDPANPTVSTEPLDSLNPADPGRKIVFTLGDVSNSNAIDGTVTVRYQAVVLDTLENQNNLSLNNAAALTWANGTIFTFAPEVTIFEPDFELEKTADHTVALPGSIITFTLTFRHTNLSNVDAFDTVLTDVLPTGLTYIPGTLIILSGPAGGVTDDTAASTLKVTWAAFPLLTGGNRTEAVVQFQATLGNLSPGQSVENTAVLEWTSLPGDVRTAQSLYNPLSTERFYDPLSAVNVYGVNASVTITVPALPKTGFASGVVTVLPEQPADKVYANLGDFWIEIPSLNVQIPIMGVPVTESDWDLTWLADQAGWLEGTAYPTHTGNSAITGHIYLANGLPGPFVNLHTMVWGQKIIIHMDGQQYVYEVREVRRVWPNDLSILRHEEYPWLTLITCQGYQAENDYLYRVAVRAVQVSILPENETSAGK